MVDIKKAIKLNPLGFFIKTKDNKETQQVLNIYIDQGYHHYLSENDGISTVIHFYKNDSDRRVESMTVSDSDYESGWKTDPRYTTYNWQALNMMKDIISHLDEIIRKDADR